MLKALKDFEYASIKVKVGQEIFPGTFEADQVATLLAEGLVIDTSRKPLEIAVKPAVKPAKAVVNKK